jgi:hypothetical protein
VKRDVKKQVGAKRRSARRSSQLLTWAASLAALALLAYGVSQMSSIAYNDKALAVVDFSDLNAKQKRTALETANSARCTCGCGMTLAQCVATDSTCPLRDGNITRIQGMVAQAHTAAP